MASARTDPASLSDERYVDVEKGVVGETSTPPPAAVTEAPTLSLTPSRLSTSRLAFALAVFHFFVPPALPPTTQVAETRWQRFLECCGIPLMAFVRWVHTAELVYWLYYPTLTLCWIPLLAFVQFWQTVQVERDIREKRTKRNEMESLPYAYEKGERPDAPTCEEPRLMG